MFFKGVRLEKIILNLFNMYFFIKFKFLSLLKTPEMLVSTEYQFSLCRGIFSDIDLSPVSLYKILVCKVSIINLKLINNLNEKSLALGRSSKNIDVLLLFIHFAILACNFLKLAFKKKRAKVVIFERMHGFLTLVKKFALKLYGFWYALYIPEIRPGHDVMFSFVISYLHSVLVSLEPLKLNIAIFMRSL